MSPDEREGVNVTRIAALLVLCGGVAALFIGINYFFAILFFGFLIVVPIISILAGEYGSELVEEMPTGRHTNSTSEHTETETSERASEWREQTERETETETNR